MNDRTTYRHSVYYLALLFLFMMVAFWPLSFYVFSPKNDALNYFLPVRRLVSESFHSGSLPLWTPYLNLGYPLHGDMQSGVWNPVVQLLSVFGPYRLYTLVVETLIYIFVSGAGMFVLLKFFNVHPYANLLASVAFMLCGFNTDCCQFPNWIAGSACIPFLFLFFYRTLMERSWRQGVFTGGILFLLFTCAYPADFILGVYLLAAMFLWKLAASVRKKEGSEFITGLALPLVATTVAFLALSAPAIISYGGSLPLTQRGAGASYPDAMSNPLHALLISAYTTPLSTWKMPFVSATDPLERNSFIGLVTFIFLCTAFFQRSSTGLLRFCKYALMVSFIFSLGEVGGLRTLSYYTMPLMNAFRHPANAKLFTTLFGCILAAFTADAWLHDRIPRRAVARGWLLAATIGVLVLLFALVVNNIPATGAPSGSFLKDRMAHISFRQIVIGVTIIQIPFFILARRWLFSRSNARHILVLGIVNSILFCIAMQPIVVVKNAKAHQIQQLIDQQAVAGYPLPDLNNSLQENSRDGMQLFKEIGVLNLYNKKVGRVDYRITPSNLLTQNAFWADDMLRETLMNYPLLYRADSAGMLSGRTNIAANPDKRSVWVARQSQADSINALPPSRATFAMQKFSPDRFDCYVESGAPGYYVLMQNYFPNWVLRCDNKPIQVDMVDRTFMGFGIPAGKHLVTFTYQVPGLTAACWLSAIFTIITLLIAFWPRRSFTHSYISRQ